jgi:hypothetical protein
MTENVSVLLEMGSENFITLRFLSMSQTILSQVNFPCVPFPRITLHLLEYGWLPSLQMVFQIGVVYISFLDQEL